MYRQGSGSACRSVCVYIYVYVYFYAYVLLLVPLCRQGSGSACRSVYGGFVEWQKGEMDGRGSRAVQVSDPPTCLYVMYTSWRTAV